jgi:RNA polymerase sigma-70 factor (ECF subfamily)
MNPLAGRRAYPETAPATPEDAEDLALVARMAAGDQHALATFYDRWARSVSSLVRGLVSDGDEAEDVLEDCFWQMWRQASRYDASRGNVSTWLLTIARTRSLDRLRARRRRGEESLTPALLQDLDARHAEDGEDPAQSAERSERRVRVVNALQELPAEQRQVVELAYFGGLTQTEIAHRTGSALGTVKTRARLALEKLRTSLSMLRDPVRSPTGRDDA